MIPPNRTLFRATAGLFAVSALFAFHPACAQRAVHAIPDPANLTGEHIAPPSLVDTLPINHGPAALQQLLLKLNTRASLMLIVAHPDDEDGGMLTYESRGQGARVAMLTLTRGEGGQNLMSADFDDALGLIRTQELLAEDRYTGTDQMFGSEVDFGFSKTREETLSKWTHERVLYDAVRAVRLYRPLVLASVFLGEPTDGHGHHQVAGEIAQEVFAAAADPKVFPEMGLAPWAPLKLYVRVPFAPVNEKGMYDYATGKFVPPQFRNYYTGKVATSEPQANVQIHEGELATVNGKPALGMDNLSYVQFARKGLALQRSQIGPGIRLAPAGRMDSGYIRYGSRVPGQPNQFPGEESGFFSGINTSVSGLATLVPSATPAFQTQLKAQLASLDQNIASAQRAFNPVQLESCAPPLRQAFSTVQSLISQVQNSALPADQRYNLLHELEIKRVQLNDALVLALHLTLTAQADQAATHPENWIVAGTSRSVEVHLHSSPPVRIESVVLAGPTRQLSSQLSKPQPEQPELTLHVALSVPPDAPLTRPYFSRRNAEQPFYNISDPTLRNAPAAPAAATVTASFRFEGVPLVLKSSVAAGSPATPLAIVPQFSASVHPSIGIESTANRSTAPLAMSVDVLALAQGAAMVALDLPSEWTAKQRQPTASQPSPSVARETSFLISPRSLAESHRYHVQASAKFDGVRYTEGIREAGYPGLTPTNFYTPAIYTAVAVNVRTAPNLRVGYLPGTGDDVASFLPNLGIQPTLLTVADLTAHSLARFDTVILGVRAYAAHPELAGAGSKPLLDFARNGGTVIVQYNNSVYAASSAPAPITVPGDPGHNVVVEADPVTLLAPNNPLLSFPNKITSADFNGWVEERGHGFATTWDVAYTPLLEMHDPGQNPQRGGLLIANVGRGYYVYCALALYRQLPEGVPGAYRLFANLLSLPKAPAASK